MPDGVILYIVGSATWAIGRWRVATRLCMGEGGPSWVEGKGSEYARGRRVSAQHYPTNLRLAICDL